MKKLHVILLALSALCIAGLAQAASSSKLFKTAAPLAEHGASSYFVHLREAPLAQFSASSATAAKKGAAREVMKSAAANTYRNQLAVQQQDFRALAANKLGRSIRVSESYQVAVNAIVMELTNDEVQLLKQMPQVKHIERLVLRELHSDRGPTHIKAADMWQGAAGFAATKGEGVIVGIIDTGVQPDHPSFADVGDDGYDHTNPLGTGNYFGDCVDDPSLCNDKLIGLFTYPDIQAILVDAGLPPYGIDYNGHGTHVASTAAGNVLRNVPAYNVLGQAGDYEFAELSGVAPHANIVSYQVCYPDGGGCNPGNTVLAIEHAILNGIDVLNYSVGGPAESPWTSTEAMAFLSARVAGIHVAVSAGNEGPDPSTVKSPANAPWLTSVAAFTHDRSTIDPTLTAFTGGNSIPAEISGKGISGSVTSDVVLASAFGDAGCLSPFAANTFSGQIVVCERGEIARVQKSANVKEGGAGGMVLINTWDWEDVVADFHVLPAIHVDFSSGQQLVSWLSEGSGHRMQLTGGTYTTDAGLADQAGVFSSRGPGIPFTDWLVPSVAAPGVDILAGNAAYQPFFEITHPGPFAFMSGTSMASPHVAGALALLDSVHPDWTPAEAQSALMTAAETATRREDGEPSTPFDAGAGRIDVAAAAKAGLVLDITEAEYLAADPALNGVPADLNLPTVTNAACIVTCTVQRRVRATQAGDWTVTTSSQTAGVSINVHPTSFSLAAGAEKVLDITITAAEIPSSEWSFGEILLQPAVATLTPTRLPVLPHFILGQLPERVSLTTQRDADSAPIEGIRVLSTTDLQVALLGQGTSVPHSAQLEGDPTPFDWLDDIEGNVHSVQVSTTTRTRAIVAEITSADAPDLDLYIGRDLNMDGKPSYAESWPYVCVSGGVDSSERCVVHDPAPGVYWIAVHNYQGTGNTPDSHVLAITTVDDEGEGMTVTAPRTAGTGVPVDVHVQWDLPLPVDASHVAILGVGTSAMTPENVGRSVIELTRTGNDIRVEAEQQEVVGGEDIEYVVSLAPNGRNAHEYDLRFELPDGYSLIESDGTATRDGNSYAWKISQAANSGETNYRLVLQTAVVLQDTSLQLVLEHTRDGRPETASQSVAPSVAVLGGPIALIFGVTDATRGVTPGAKLRVDASMSRGLRDKSAVMYNWQQTAGEKAQLVDKGEGIFELEVPNRQVDLEYQLVISSEGRESAPAKLKVSVLPVSPGGGGGFDILTLALLFTFVIFAGRRMILRCGRSAM